jgi:hypothetical protein
MDSVRLFSFWWENSHLVGMKLVSDVLLAQWPPIDLRRAYKASLGACEGLQSYCWDVSCSLEEM